MTLRLLNLKPPFTNLTLKGSLKKGALTPLAFLLLANPVLAAANYNTTYFQGLVFLSKRDYKKASDYFERAIKLNPRPVEALVEQAWTLNKLTKFNDAIKYATRALALHPRHVRALEQVASAKFQMGKLDEGLDLCRQIAMLNPESQRCEFWLTELKKTRGTVPNWAKPSALADDALEIKIRSLSDTGKYNEALKLLEDVLKKNPDDREVAFRHGFINEMARREQAAIKDYSNILKKFPMDEKALKHRSELYETLKKPEAAIPDLNALILINPTHWNARYRLAYAYSKAEKYKDALLQYDCMAMINPSSVEVHSGRAQCYMKLGQYQKAADDLTKAIKLNPNPSGAQYFKRGLAYDRLGEVEKMESDFATAKKLGYKFVAPTDEIQYPGK